jgi:hypothetical protein
LLDVASRLATLPILQGIRATGSGGGGASDNQGDDDGAPLVASLRGKRVVVRDLVAADPKEVAGSGACGEVVLL